MKKSKLLALMFASMLSLALGLLFPFPPLASVGLILSIYTAIKAIIVFKRQSNRTEHYLKKQLNNAEYYPSFIITAVVIALLQLILFVLLFASQVDFNDIVIFPFIVIALLIGIPLCLLSTYVYFLPYLIANKKNHPQTRAIYILNIFAAWTIIAWIIALVWANTESKDKPVPLQTVFQSGADELKKYKELLDSGVITQEEFDAKKKQLLGL